MERNSSQQILRPLGPAFPNRGVFAADPHRPPTPPPGAEASEIMAANGERIGWFWTSNTDPRIRELAMQMAYDYLDEADPVISGPRLVK